MDGVPGDPPGIFGCKEGDDTADVVGLRKTLQRLHAQGEVTTSVCLGEIRHVRLNNTGCYGIDADAACAKHRGEMLHQSVDGALGGCDLNEVIADSLQMLSPEAVKRNVALHVNGIQQPLLVRADRIHLQQVILNLARNGMDAMSDTARDARRLTIQTALPEGAEVEVSVSDSGMGIPKDKLDVIFDTFYTTKAQGTGLGLSIVRTIVESYGGKIWAENRAEGGCRISLHLAVA
jgi:C4-dicarboxylate-specific signal transduction histidine kinase